jgi:TolB-like protein/Flp pilus assembly protein TadD/class 3 adenylate cyclase
MAIEVNRPYQINRAVALMPVRLGPKAVASLAPKQSRGGAREKRLQLPAMADEHKAKRLEIAHVLFMDIVGYSKLLTDEQSEALQELNQIVRSTEAAREAEAAGELTVLPTGDGMALVFTGSVEEPVECALEISQALRAQPSLPVRMGIHSGPIHHVKDANERENIAGIGINIAQRVMDCGDAGHILVSKRVADDLAQQRRWQPYIHELGDVEVKHGVVVSLVNLYAETIGNPTPPSRIGKARGSIPSFRVGTRKALSPLALAILIVAILLLGLAIVSVIFAPAIMRTLDKRGLATLPQPTATAPPSLADTIKSAVAKQITDELQAELSRKKNAAVQPPLSGSALPEKSIAVLPFENLSEDKSNAYFAEGVQDEILTRLAKIGDLKVISRTSTQRYKSSPENLPEIAKQLGVAHILEGTVQKSGDNVRVAVQLIRAATDSHLWAETYDRKLTDIFAVESEIAKTIAESLRVKLSGTEQSAIAARPTENSEAHDLYLRGRYFVEKRTGDDFKRAIDYFNQAIAKDPNYALAYAGIADSYVLLPQYSNEQPGELFPKAKLAAEKALAIDSNLGEAHVSLGLVLQGVDLNLKEAKREFERALELNPNDAAAHYFLGLIVLAPWGQFDQAIAEVKRAIELDPFSVIMNANLGYCYFLARRYPEAIAQLRKATELDPNFPFTRAVLGVALELNGDSAEAIREYEKAYELEKGYPAGARHLGLVFLAHAYALQGERAKALQFLGQAQDLEQRHGGVPAYGLAVIYLGLGEKEQAIDWLERSYRAKETGIIRMIKVDPLLDSLRGDPRFEKLSDQVVPPDSH